MNLIPEDKTKAAIYGGVAAVILLLALYFGFFRGGGGEPVPAEVENRAAQITEGMQAPQPSIPEVPPEQRPQRGPPAAPQ